MYNLKHCCCILFIFISSTIYSQFFQKIDEAAIYTYSGIVLTTGTGTLLYYHTKNSSIALSGGFVTPIITGVGQKITYHVFRLGTYNNLRIFNLFWGGSIGAITLFAGINMYETHQKDLEFYRTFRIHILPDSLQYNNTVSQDTIK